MNSIHRDMLIQRRQFSLFVNSQSDEVNISNLSMGDDHVWFHEFKQTYIIRQKLMTLSFTELAKDFENRRKVSRSICLD
jgi:hypothetical protein